MYRYPLDTATRAVARRRSTGSPQSAIGQCLDRLMKHGLAPDVFAVHAASSSSCGAGGSRGGFSASGRWAATRYPAAFVQANRVAAEVAAALPVAGGPLPQAVICRRWIAASISLRRQPFRTVPSAFTSTLGTPSPRRVALRASAV